MRSVAHRGEDLPLPRALPHRPGEYRVEGELERWKLRDPIDLLGARLAADGVLDAEAQRTLHTEFQGQVDLPRPRRRGADSVPRGDEGLCLRALNPK